MENWQVPGLVDPILAGQLELPLSPERTLQQLAVDDVGAFAAIVLRNRSEWLGRALDIAGDERTMRAVADAFARTFGRPVEYRQLLWDDYRQALGKEYFRMMRWFEDVGYDADITAARKVYPDLTTFESHLMEVG